jgi:hypothetical protein
LTFHGNANKGLAQTGSQSPYDAKPRGLPPARLLKAGLFENPRLNFFVMYAQEVERASDVVLFPHSLGRMALNLRADTARNVQPLAQAGEGSTKAVQGQLQASGGAGVTVGNAGFFDMA